MEIIPANHRIDDCIDIRRRVFVCEQGIDISLEIDEKDEPESGCLHFLMLEGGVACGTFRAYYEDETTVHLQRFCILPEYRGRSFGRDALKFIEGFFTAKGASLITFGAQITAIPFYEKCGYECVSGFFDDAGIPHRTMQKRLFPQ